MSYQVFDVNMNTTMPSKIGKRPRPDDIQSPIQAQVSALVFSLKLCF